MKKEIEQKVAACKALQDKSVKDIIATPRYLKILSAYINAQRVEREAARANYEKIKPYIKGMKLPAHPIDKVINLTPEEFAEEWLGILAHRNPRPSAERLYIQQLARQAYCLAVAEIVCEEYPELRDELIPQLQKSN